MRITFKTAAFAATLGLLVPLAACGSSSDEPPSQGTPQQTLDKGTAADASLDPVLIGFQSALNGTFALPDVKEGFDAGVKFVNERQGGVDGHPLEVAICGTDGTPDSSVDCANQFVQKDVVLGTIGFDYGADASLPVLTDAGIGEFSYQAVTPALNAATGDAFFTLPSVQESYSSDLVMHKSRGAKSVAIVTPDLPSSRSAFKDVITPAAKKLGLEVEAFYYPSPTDWASFAATVVTTKPSAITLYAADPDSLAAVTAIRGSGFTGTINAATSTSLVGKLPDATLKDVVFITPFFSDIYSSSALSEKVSADLAAFNTYMKPTEKTNIGYAQIGFHVAVQAADALRQVSVATGEPLTSASVLKNLPTIKGPLFFRDSSYDCASPSWPGTSACSEGLYYAEVGKDGKLTPLENSPMDVGAVRPSS